MSWSKKIILAANFYGSYLLAEAFDDTVIIPDGGINQLLPAVQRRVEVFYNLTNGEAEIIVFCVVGVTDMLEKTMQNGKYILKPIPDALRQIEIRMENAIDQLRKYRVKIIWSTTYPISLAKYHKSQGWDISNMFTWGFSRNMEVEQNQLYFMCEQFMDLCHSYNQRIGMNNCFFIRKVYYSHEGQRELLTHNLLEDGINPSPSVTAEWNLELATYLQAIRKPTSASGGSGVFSSSQANNSNTAHQGLNTFGVGTGDTLFNYGDSFSQQSSAFSGSSRFAMKSAGSPTKRQYESQQGGNPKRSKVELEQVLFNKLGTQSEDVQKKLAMGMLKFIAENVGEDVLDATTGGAKSSADSSMGYHQFPSASGRPIEAVSAQKYQKKQKQPVDVYSKREAGSNVRVSVDQETLHKGSPLVTNFQPDGKNENSPVSAKSRLNLAPSARKMPLLTTPGIKPRSIKDRLAAKKQMGHITDDYLLNNSHNDHKAPGPMLIEPRRNTDGRQVQLQYNPAPPPNQIAPLIGAQMGRQNFPFNPPFLNPGASINRPFLNPGAPVNPPFFNPGASSAYNNIAAMPTGVPYLLKSTIIGDEPIVARDNHGLRDDYILMAVKTSAQTAKFSRVMADYNDRVGDQLGIIKLGSQRFPCFSKARVDRDTLPSVTFLKTNQWKPGFERNHAPMTLMQKEVADFNVALYQLMKKRVRLIKALRKGNDMSICLPRKKQPSEGGSHANVSKANGSKTTGNPPSGKDGEKAAVEDDVSTPIGANKAAESTEASDKPDNADNDDWEDMDDSVENCMKFGESGEKPGDSSANPDNKDDEHPLIIIDDDDELETYAGAQKSIQGKKLAEARVGDDDLPIVTAEIEDRHAEARVSDNSPIVIEEIEEDKHVEEDEIVDEDLSVPDVKEQSDEKEEAGDSFAAANQDDHQKEVDEAGDNVNNVSDSDIVEITDRKPLDTAEANGKSAATAETNEEISDSNAVSNADLENKGSRKKPESSEVVMGKSEEKVKAAEPTASKSGGDSESNSTIPESSPKKRLRSSTRR